MQARRLRYVGRHLLQHPRREREYSAGRAQPVLNNPLDKASIGSTRQDNPAPYPPVGISPMETGDR